MDQSAPQQLSTRTLEPGMGTHMNGHGDPPGDLADHVAAVEQARERLGRDLEVLTGEVKAQMGETLEKTLWKGATAVAALLSALVARKLLMAAWQKTTHTDPPTDLESPTTRMRDALAWSVATGAAMGVAKLVAARGTAFGWKKATGSLPPGVGDVAA